MGGRSNSFKNWILQQIFASDSNLYIRLYTSAVVVSDSVIGTEATFGAYPAGGLLVVGSAANWTIVGNAVTNALEIVFPTGTSGPEIIRYFAIWSDNTTFDESARLYWGQLTNDIEVGINMTVSVSAGFLDIVEN